MRYRYTRNDNNGLMLFILILVIGGIILGVKYKEDITIFIDNAINSFAENSDEISLDEAEAFFYKNKTDFEGLITNNIQNTVYIDNNYISIIDRYDFGGNYIRAFRFQNKTDIGTEIVYSKTELQESSILRKIEKNWYVYNFINN